MPIELSKSGKEILQITGGKNYIDNNLLSLISSMEKETFKSPFDIQDFACTLLWGKVDEDGFTPIKNYIYWHIF